MSPLLFSSLARLQKAALLSSSLPFLLLRFQLGLSRGVAPPGGGRGRLFLVRSTRCEGVAVSPEQVCSPGCGAEEMELTNPPPRSPLH